MRHNLPHTTLATLATLLGLTAGGGASAQSLTWDGAILGEQIDYMLAGDPGELYVLGISAFPGPTPLSLIDPSDPRSLSIGFTSLGLWRSGTLDGAGAAIQTYLLPATPAQVGFVIHSQFVTLPGTSTLIDDISNPVSYALALHGSQVNTVGLRVLPTDSHSSSGLADGRVLVAGGVVRSDGGDFVTDAIELYDPLTQQFSPSGALLQGLRARQTATLLPDGRTLLLGGANDISGNAVSTGDLYDPVTDSTSPTANMSVARSGHTATLLLDGRVLVVGGSTFDNTTDVFNTADGAHATSELYDPVGGSWSAGPDLPLALFGHAATRLTDGRVLVSGGIEVESLFGFPQLTHTPVCHRYDPVTNAWLGTAPLPSERAFHAQVLPSGDSRPIAAGGNRFTFFLTYEFLAETVQYDPLLDSWSQLGALNGTRAYASLVDTGNELVLVGGFADIDNSQPVPVVLAEQTVETAPLDGSAWTEVVEMVLPTLGACASVVDGGARVLITGVGDDGTSAIDSTAEVFVP